MHKFWRANAQHRDYTQQQCFIYFKIPKRLDLKPSDYKNNNYIMGQRH